MLHTTDLRSSERQTVLVVQPKAIAELDAAELSRRMKDEGFLADVARQVLAFYHMVHVGTLKFQLCERALLTRAANLQFKPCDGTLTSSGSGSEERWTCEKQQACGLSLLEVCGEDAGQRRSVMLYLLLKQMVPQMPACNFLDCNRVGEEDFPDGTDVKELRAVQGLGLIALADHVVSCSRKVPSKTKVTIYSRYTLGVLLADGMNTQGGCEGYGNWLQLLVAMSHQMLLQLHNEFLPLLAGPKRV